MNEDFCALILTHGRPDKVVTHRTLRRSGYTGPIFLLVDDEDESLPLYRERYGDQVVTFSKSDIAARFDEADNFEDRRSVFYARNAAFDVAASLGFKRFIQLDDDYTAFSFRAGRDQAYGTWNITCLDEVFRLLLEYFESIPAASLCFCQGGDFIGGIGNAHVADVTFKRKAMNTFICDTERPFSFLGRINEDVNTYVGGARKGDLFLTITSVQVNQKQTQSNAGGMTELYLDAGTYVKSFYSVMTAPSCVVVGEIGSSHRRLHHHIDWPAAAVQIVHERHRKVAGA